MPDEIEAELFAPPPVNVVPLRGRPVLDRIVVTTADGRRFDLGRPDSPLFRLRLRLYTWRRRSELEAARG